MIKTYCDGCKKEIKNGLEIFLPKYIREVIEAENAGCEPQCFDENGYPPLEQKSDYYLIDMCPNCYTEVTKALYLKLKEINNNSK